MSALTVRLNDNEHEALRLYAQRKGRSLQAVVREAIRSEIGSMGNDHYGAFDSGDPTVTSDWDSQMVGFGEWR